MDFQLSLDSEGVGSAYPDQPLAATVTDSIGQVMQLLRAQRTGAMLVCDGEKLVGEWVLVRMGKRRGEARNPWLLIKHRDETASKRDIAEEEPRSVVSGRLLVEIARDEGGNMKKAADGDPPALLRKMLEDPSLVKPPKKSRKKSVWHSNRRTG